MRREILSVLVSVFAVMLLGAGLWSSFLGESGGYKISPELKQPEPRADAAGSSDRTMPPAVTPAKFRLRPDETAVVTAGKALYAEHCASCHGANLEGQPNWKRRGADGLMPAPPHDASGHTWHHPGGMLFAVTKFGSTRITGQPSAMPGFAGVMSDEEIVATLSYIKSTWPADIQKRHDEMSRKRGTR